jgi:hypothetical protein
MQFEAMAYNQWNEIWISIVKVTERRSPWVYGRTLPFFDHSGVVLFVCLGLGWISWVLKLFLYIMLPNFSCKFLNYYIFLAENMELSIYFELIWLSNETKFFYEAEQWVSPPCIFFLFLFITQRSTKVLQNCLRVATQTQGSKAMKTKSMNLWNKVDFHDFQILWFLKKIILTFSRYIEFRSSILWLWFRLLSLCLNWDGDTSLMVGGIPYAQGNPQCWLKNLEYHPLQLN